MFGSYIINWIVFAIFRFRAIKFPIMFLIQLFILLIQYPPNNSILTTLILRTPMNRRRVLTLHPRICKWIRDMFIMFIFNAWIIPTLKRLLSIPTSWNPINLNRSLQLLRTYLQVIVITRCENNLGTLCRIWRNIKFIWCTLPHVCHEFCLVIEFNRGVCYELRFLKLNLQVRMISCLRAQSR